MLHEFLVSKSDNQEMKTIVGVMHMMSWVQLSYFWRYGLGYASCDVEYYWSHQP